MGRLFLLLTLLSGLWGEEPEGFPLRYLDLMEEPRQVFLSREKPEECLELSLAPEILWGGAMAHPSVPAACKRTFVTTKGSLQPIRAAEGVETYGEVEVLEFLRDKAGPEPERYILVDSRSAKWYETRTIPGAVNMLVNLSPPDKPTLDGALRKLGVKIRFGAYDFREAKTALLFCNGPWCAQSRLTILALLSIGYPPEKLKWYRGGLQDWLAAGLTSVVP